MTCTTLDIHYTTTEPSRGKYPISVMSTTSIKQQLKVYKTITARASRRRRRRRRRHSATLHVRHSQNKSSNKHSCQDRKINHDPGNPSTLAGWLHDRHIHWTRSLGLALSLCRIIVLLEWCVVKKHFTFIDSPVYGRVCVRVRT